MRRTLLFLGLLSIGFSLAAETYLTPGEALKLAFKNSATVVSEQKRLTPEQKASAEKILGRRLPKEDWNFSIGKTGKRVDGYVLIDQEIGKTEPITFMTVITPAGKVREVEVLAYREPIGGEVRAERFLKQYQKKGVADPLKVGGDIVNITGATISCKSVTAGVKRALALWNVFYGK